MKSIIIEKMVVKHVIFFLGRVEETRKTYQPIKFLKAQNGNRHRHGSRVCFPKKVFYFLN